MRLKLAPPDSLFSQLYLLSCWIHTDTLYCTIFNTTKNIKYRHRQDCCCFCTHSSCYVYVRVDTYIRFVVLCDMNLKILQRRVKTGSNNNNSIICIYPRRIYTRVYKRMFMGKFIWHKCPFVPSHHTYTYTCVCVCVY